MNLTKPLATVDSEMVKFLTTLGPGRVRHLFAPEVIDYSEINSYLELKGKKQIPQPSTEKEVVVDIGIQFVREEISANLIKFTLSHGLFGNLGVLWLSFADVCCTDFDIEEPLFPTREEAKRYSQFLLETKPSLFNYSGDAPVPLEAIMVTLPANGLHERRINLQQTIVDAFQVVVMGSSGEVKTVNDENLIRGFFVRLAFANAKDEVEKFLWHQQTKLSFSRISIEIPEGYAYDIRHKEFGDLGQCSLHPREGDRTRIRITRPLPPNIKDAVDIALRAGLDVVSSDPLDLVEWVLQEREKENNKFRQALYDHLKQAEGGNFADPAHKYRGERISTGQRSGQYSEYQEFRNKVTVGDLRNFEQLEKSAKEGDPEAIQKLSDMGNVEFYRKAISEMDGLWRKAASEMGEVWRNALKDSIQINVPNSLLSTPDIYQRPEDRLAREMAENNRLQRELLERLTTSDIPASHNIGARKPKRQRAVTRRQQRSVQGMVDMIAYRRSMMQTRKQIPAWTYKYEGRIDQLTANRIDEDCGGELRLHWHDKNFESEFFINKLLETYQEYSSRLRIYWNELKNTDSVDF